MCSASASSSNLTLDSAKLVKFVELLVHDYLQVKGFTATGEKFAQECSNCARDRDTDSSKKNRHGSGGSADSTASNGESAVDEAGSWYYLADKLALPVGWIPACGALFVDDNISVPYTEIIIALKPRVVNFGSEDELGHKQYHGSSGEERVWQTEPRKLDSLDDSCFSSRRTVRTYT